MEFALFKCTMLHEKRLVFGRAGLLLMQPSRVESRLQLLCCAQSGQPYFGVSYKQASMEGAALVDSSTVECFKAIYSRACYQHWWKAIHVQEGSQPPPADSDSIILSLETNGNLFCIASVYSEAEVVP